MKSSCRLYVATELDQKELGEELSNLLNLKRISTSFFDSDFFELDIDKNDEFNKKSQCQFPDGFLYFKFTIWIDFKDAVVNDSHIFLVSKILTWLWDRKIPAVAASDYEDQLPNNGGYKSLLIPWPKEINEASASV